MNSQRKQIITMAVLGAVLLGVLVYQFGIKGTAPVPTPTAAAAKPAGAAAQASAPAGQAAHPPANGAQPAAPVKVDIDMLLASIQEVDFDYERDRIPRDVLTPLIGKVAVMDEQNGDAKPVAPATLGQVMSKVVTGIVWDENYPVAVVDNEVVEPGYEYADGTVVDSIEEDRVVFRIGESLIQVELKER